MRSFWLFSALLGTAWGAPSVPTKRELCENSATNRSCWGDYDITTNYYDEAPDTGVVREYYFELVNTTASPDGYERVILTVNGTIPGPTIEANWGDTVVVHLHNGLADNGTSLHFHGMRQYYTNDQDGVASITQCPTAPGDSITYTWKADQYGSSWYHSHFMLQAWEGVFGPIVIHGPASANYDVDLGPLMLVDWSHETIDALYPAEVYLKPPTLDNILFNGLNTFEADVGQKFEFNVTAGETYRLRLTNAAADNHMIFSIDNHTLTVIAADFVPVEPFNVTSLPIGMGQRYDVIFTASAGSGDYWVRAEPQCTTVINVGDLTAILRYDASSTANPTSTSWAYDTNCGDLDPSLFSPILQLDFDPDADTDYFTVSPITEDDGVVLWLVNDISFVSEWDYPTNLAILDNNRTWSEEENVVQLDEADAWVYFIVQATSAAYHPLHLHGHDVYLLAQGSGTYLDLNVTLNTSNPLRRDVVMLPGNGYVVFGFITDNPGTWLLHCHISWHTSGGLVFQVVERPDELIPLIDEDRLENGCANWDAYVAQSGVLQTDSGV